MNICLLGPVVSSKKMGGVATFVESLAGGFSLLNCHVVILTNYTEKDYVHGAHIISFGNCSPLMFLIKTYWFLLKNPQDLIIGSTWFDLSVLLPMVNGIKFHYLHGFGVPIEGVLKAVCIAINDRLHRINGLLISNSYFTKMINEIIYCNKVDEVIPIGVTTDFCDIEDNVDRDIDVLFVGRAVYNKGVYNLIKAIKYYNESCNKKLKFVLVGDGDELKKIQEYDEKWGLMSHFIGSIRQKETMAFYKRSKIFVSLDPREPYGQTFIEAKICGCKVICPTSGGQIEYLKDMNDVKMVKFDNVESIADGIKELLEQNGNDFKFDGKVLYKKYSYEMVAKDILNYYKKIKINK